MTRDTSPVDSCQARQRWRFEPKAPGETVGQPREPRRKKGQSKPGVSDPAMVPDDCERILRHDIRHSIDVWENGAKSGREYRHPAIFFREEAFS
jgi:murein endopeptidase